MLVKYNGNRKMFTYQNIDFSAGVAEVADDIALKWIAESNGTFTDARIPAPVVKATPTLKAKKPVAKKPVAKKPVAKKPAVKK